MIKARLHSLIIPCIRFNLTVFIAIVNALISIFGTMAIVNYNDIDVTKLFVDGLLCKKYYETFIVYWCFVLFMSMISFLGLVRSYKKKKGMLCAVVAAFLFWFVFGCCAVLVSRINFNVDVFLSRIVYDSKFNPDGNYGWSVIKDMFSGGVRLGTFFGIFEFFSCLINRAVIAFAELRYNKHKHVMG